MCEICDEKLLPNIVNIILKLKIIQTDAHKRKLFFLRTEIYF